MFLAGDTMERVKLLFLKIAQSDLTLYPAKGGGGPILACAQARADEALLHHTQTTPHVRLGLTWRELERKDIISATIRRFLGWCAL